MKKFIDNEENILNVTVYKHPRLRLDIVSIILNHQFVVLKTNKQWWWSIEKNSEGIVIQRSQHVEYVRDKLERNDRPTPIEEIKTATGRRTMMQLIEFLVDEKELQREISYSNRAIAKRLHGEFFMKWHLYHCTVSSTFIPKLMLESIGKIHHYNDKIVKFWTLRRSSLIMKKTFAPGASMWLFTNVLFVSGCLIGHTVSIGRAPLNHKFVVLETNKQWWSIEKNSEVVAFYHSKKPTCWGYVRTSSDAMIDQVHWWIGSSTNSSWYWTEKNGYW